MATRFGYACLNMTLGPKKGGFRSMIKRTFAPGFRIVLHQKDLNLALQSAKELGVALPNTASTQQLFSACIASGNGQLDHSGLVKALETLSNHKVAPDEA